MVSRNLNVVDRSNCVLSGICYDRSTLWSLLVGIVVERKDLIMLRIIYMGTPQFAVPALAALLKGAAPGTLLPEGYEIVMVITRPDKPVGRGRDIVFSPIKQAALAHNIPVWQSGSLK